MGKSDCEGVVGNGARKWWAGGSAGPRPAIDIYRDALAAGISERTLERAKRLDQAVSKLDINKQTQERRWM